MPAETAAGYAAFLQADSMAFEGITDAKCLDIDMHTLLRSYRLSYIDIGTKTRATLEAHPQTGLPILLKTWTTGDAKSTTLVEFTYEASITVTAPVQLNPP